MEKRDMNKILVLLVCLFFLILILFSGCTENKASSEKTSSEKSIGFVEIGPYELASNPVLINGKLAFWAIVDLYGGNRVVYDGKPVKAYRSTGPPVNIGEKLAFWTVFPWGGNEVGIIYDEQEIGRNYKIYRQGLFDFEGKLLYVAKKGEKRVIVYDGQEMETDYDSIGGFVVIDGKLTYRGHRDGKYFIVYDGDELETQYSAILPPVNIGEKLAYIARKDDKSFVVFEGEEGHSYGGINNLIDAGGKPAYVASENGAFFVVYDGVEGPRYFRIIGLVDAGGKPAYYASNMYDETFIVIGDQAYQYDDASKPAIINGKLVFAAKEGNEWFIYYDGQKIETKYKEIGGFKEVGGKLAFSAKKSGEEYIVMER